MNHYPAPQSQHSTASMRTFHGCVLAVDDERTSLLMLENLLKGFGCDVITARNGQEALAILEAQHDEIDIIVLDRVMPEMGGLELVRIMKQRRELQFIPVIMQTGSKKPEEIREGIDAGVMYYLTKPINKDLLQTVVGTALNDAAEHKRMFMHMHHQNTSAELMDTARFLYRSLDEATSLTSALSAAYPQPERVVTGLGELLINAIEHGNLGIGYEDKARFVKEGRWREEVIRRSKLPENAHKKVEVIFKRKADGIYLQITDAGAGFDWWPYLEIDPARAMHHHGRGIALANKLSFDKLNYKEPGNQLVAVVYFNSKQNQPLNW